MLPSITIARGDKGKIERMMDEGIAMEDSWHKTVPNLV
jgi:hypothetical protein